MRYLFRMNYWYDSFVVANNRERKNDNNNNNERKPTKKLIPERCGVFRNSLSCFFFLFFAIKKWIDLNDTILSMWNTNRLTILSSTSNNNLSEAKRTSFLYFEQLLLLGRPKLKSFQCFNLMFRNRSLFSFHFLFPHHEDRLENEANLGIWIFFSRSQTLKLLNRAIKTIASSLWIFIRFSFKPNQTKKKLNKKQKLASSKFILIFSKEKKIRE